MTASGRLFTLLKMSIRLGAAFLIISLLSGAPARADDAASIPAPAPRRRIEQTPGQAFLFAKTKVENAPGAEPLVKIMDVATEQIRKEPGKADEIVRQQLDGVNLAAENVQKQPEVPPETARAINDAMADLNVRAGGYEQGLRFADRSLAAHPDDRDALLSRSNANVGLKDFAAAHDDASRAIKLAPEDPEGYTARAVAEYNMRQYQQASEDSRRALALDANDRVAFAIMKLAEGKSMTVDVDSLKARMGGEIQREYNGMVQQLNQAEEKRLAPGPSTPAPDARVTAAGRLTRDAADRLSVKDYYGAIDAANAALAQDPSNVAALYYRAAAYNLLGDYERAVEDASRALVFNPGDASTHDTRAWAFNHMGRYRDAIADSNHSLELNPQNPYAFANLSYSHEQMGDFSSMLRELRTAATLNAQFEATYRDAAARHGLAPDPLPSDSFLPPRRDPAERERKRSFLFLVGSAVIGGVLIALGFFNLAGDSGKTTRSAVGRPPTAPPQVQAGYALGRRIGMGGMGIVYEAVDQALQRKVAIKIMREELQKDGSARQRFLDEARTVAALHHPGIVDIHAIVEDSQRVCLVFEFVDGQTLDEVLRERGRVPLASAKAIMRELCSALDFAHRHLVVHRDIKPANIMLAREGGAKLMDFGISRHAREALEGSRSDGKATGTPTYMAPEQRFGAVRKESDVFSLGAVLYEMATGRCPFPGATSEELKLNRGYLRPSQLAADLPPELDTFIDHALDPDPERRIPSAREFMALLERIPDRRG